MTQLATIGHNQAPDEVEIVKQRLAEYKEIPDRLTNLEKIEIPTVIEDDETASKLSDFRGNLKNLTDDIEKAFTKEKKPFWDAGKAADTWKNDYGTKIKSLDKKAESILLAWNQKKKKAEEDRLAEIAKKAREEAEKLAEQAVIHESEGIKDTAEDLMQAALNADAKADMIESGSYVIKTASRGSFSSSSLKTETVGRMENIATLDANSLKSFFKETEIQDAITRSIKAGVRDIQGVIYSEQDKLTTRRI